MKDRNVFVTSNAKGVEKALSENYAFLMESSSLEYEVQQNCNLTQIGGVLGSKGYGIALQKSTLYLFRKFTSKMKLNKSKSKLQYRNVVKMCYANDEPFRISH